MTFTIDQDALNCTSVTKNSESDNLITVEKMIKTIVKTYPLTAILFGSLSLKAQTIEQAEKHLDAERFTAAAKAINDLATSAPTPENLFFKGYTILESPGLNAESIKAAQAAFEAGLAADKKGSPINEVGLGMVKLASKDMAGAKAIFEQVKKDTKLKNTDVLYRIAEAYTLFSHANDPAEAIMNIDMAIEKSKAKDNPEYYIVKADAFMLKNEGGDAMNALQYAEKTGKKLGKVYDRMAKVWLQGKNYNEAEAAIAKGIAADPTHAPLYKYQSSLFQSRGKWNEAAAAAKKYLDNSDGDCKAKLRYAKLAFVSKDYENVKKTIEDIKDCSSDPYVYRMKGIMSFEENEPAKAIEYLGLFIKNLPEDENAAIDYGFTGRSYFNLPGEGATRILNDSLGVINIEKAISLGDTTFNYWGDLTGKYAKAKDYVNAAKYGEREILSKKKPLASELARLGTYFAGAKNWAKADEYVVKALDKYNNTWPAGYALSARLKSYQGDSTFKANFGSAPMYEKYLEVLGEAKSDAKNGKDVKEAYKYLAGKEFQVTKNLTKAIEYLEAYLKLDPENEEVKKQLEIIKATPAPTGGTSPGGGQ